MKNQKEYDPDRTPSQAQLDYAAGRLPNQQGFFLRCRKAREYIIGHPGVTAKQLRIDAGVKRVEIDWLIKKNFIHYDGELGLVVTPM